MYAVRFRPIPSGWRRSSDARAEGPGMSDDLGLRPRPHLEPATDVLPDVDEDAVVAYVEERRRNGTHTDSTTRKGLST